ncbi:MAG: CBS domain-containing protein [Myxococcota bacterium]|jgi:CBS domain-containing protein
MTADPICIGPEHSIGRAREVLSTNGIGILPVLDQAGRLVGVVSSSDLITGTKDLTVRDVMSRSVLLCWAGDQRGAVARLMAGEEMHHLVVRGPDNHPAGVVSVTDLARAVGQLNVPEPVSRIMTRDRLALPVDAPISEAREHLRPHGLTCVLVTDPNGRVVGSLHRTDAVWHAADPGEQPLSSLMTPRGQSASPDTPLNEVAARIGTGEPMVTMALSRRAPARPQRQPRAPAAGQGRGSGPGTQSSDDHTAFARRAG